jgi:predicted membrane protein
MTSAPEPSPGCTSTTRLWFGIGIIVFGLLLALDNLGFLHHGFFIKLWPLVLVFLGLSRLGPNQQERGISPFVFIGAGAFLLIWEFGGADFSEAIGPLFIVALGIFIVTRTLRRNRGVPAVLAAHEGYVSTTAIFGGTKRRPASQDFKGGEMTAIFGGFELDLRQAALEEGQARVDVFILFGGGEIRVPQGWSVDMKASAMFGALEDRSLHLPAPAGAAACGPTLVLTGMALFGGLTVTN